jgi:heme a synthase
MPASIMTADSKIDPRDRRVAIWLLVCCAFVAAMVVLGGVTRLTGSGLSMVDWRPLLGWLPPLGHDAWQRVFDLYRQSPEFREINAHMDLEAFKGIFWLEYFHRLLGRTIGVVFLVPFLVFLATGQIVRRDWPKYLGMFVLGGLQGALGWYMVASGLVDDPHVSQYRLVAHLSTALLIYGWMFWVALSLLRPRQTGQRHPWFRRSAWLTGLVSLTVLSGGFVAGLKAGLVYNTFPRMGEYWIPPGLTALTPFWRNLFANQVTAQFDHRVLALTTFTVIAVYWFASRRTAMPRRAAIGRNALLHAAVLQVALGISTLLLAVPVPLAAAHQATAVLLLSASLFLTHSLR